MHKMETLEIGDEIQHTWVRMLLPLLVYAAIPKGLAATTSCLALKLLVVHCQISLICLKHFG